MLHCIMLCTTRVAANSDNWLFTANMLFFHPTAEEVLYCADMLSYFQMGVISYLTELCSIWVLDLSVASV